MINALRSTCALVLLKRLGSHFQAKGKKRVSEINTHSVLATQQYDLVNSQITAAEHFELEVATGFTSSTPVKYKSIHLYA